jgi:hypothetical protein
MKQSNMLRKNNGSDDVGTGSSRRADQDDGIVSSCHDQDRTPMDAAHVPKILRGQSSVEVETRNEAKVLVFYTGGTIGMMRNENGGKMDFLLNGYFKLKRTNLAGRRYFLVLKAFHSVISGFLVDLDGCASGE